MEFISLFRIRNTSFKPLVSLLYSQSKKLKMSSTADCLLYTTVILPLLYQNTPSPNPLCCSMQGILCDQNQKITQISIGKDRNAIGSIPSELSKLDKLSVQSLLL
ncbi:hypothetical protein BC833DRAFT_76859 [Globomyces pollinis-pini]|nr:hypothetical protein BC833DRAFT_76859 [Globomyces pollinis-pini]